METFRKIKPYIFETLLYIGAFIFSLICYTIFAPLVEGTSALERGEVGKAVALIFLCAIFVTGLILWQNRKLDRKTLIFLLILASFVIRLGYVLYTEGVARQHDTYGDAGHYEYARLLFETGKMPSTNDYQFYHPPLNAFIQSRFMGLFEGWFSFVNNHALWLSANRGFLPSSETYFYACQTLALLYSLIISVTACKIFKRLGIEGVGGIIGLIFIMFFPRLIQLSGQLNNDLLCIMLSVVAFYWAIKFYQEQSWLNIVFCSLFVGFALMTKLNAATICLPIAVLFIIVFINKIKTKDLRDIVDICSKFFAFLVICAPIGLWFQVYAGIKFNQPFGYVFPYLNGELSTAEVPFYRRFLIPAFGDVFATPFANAWEDYNLLDYMTKSSMFGEFNFWNGTAFAYLAVILNYLFQLMFVVTFVFWIFHRIHYKEKIFDLTFIALGSLMVTLIVAQIYFYIKMPYGCTMDFRYVVPLILSYGGISAVMINDAKCTNLVGYKTLANLLAFFAIALVASTSIFYLVCV